jgi:hypothetical protein
MHASNHISILSYIQPLIHSFIHSLLLFWLFFFVHLFIRSLIVPFHSFSHLFFHSSPIRPRHSVGWTRSGGTSSFRFIMCVPIWTLILQIVSYSMIEDFHQSVQQVLHYYHKIGQSHTLPHIFQLVIQNRPAISHVTFRVDKKLFLNWDKNNPMYPVTLE